jgi:hypothetical protein
LRYRLQNEGIARRLSGRRRPGGRRYERIGCEDEDACELYLYFTLAGSALWRVHGCSLYEKSTPIFSHGIATYRFSDAETMRCKTRCIDETIRPLPSSTDPWPLLPPRDHHTYTLPHRAEDDIGSLFFSVQVFWKDNRQLFRFYKTADRVEATLAGGETEHSHD